MKTKWSSVLITFVFLSVIPSSAQCGMYTYQDVTADSSGNLIANNLVQVTSCQQSSTYAEAHLTMPSGAQFAATAYGADVADAVAYAPLANESGTGSFHGNANSSSDYCGFYDGSTFDFPLRIAPAWTISLSVQTPGTGTDCNYMEPCTNPAHCIQTNYCTAETSPPTCSVNNRDIKQYAVLCSPAFETPFIAYKIGSGSWKCTQGGLFTLGASEVSIPYIGALPGNCTKLP
jgi:hypothetical protein